MTAILGAIFNITTFRIESMFHFNCLYHLASKHPYKVKIRALFIEPVGQIGVRSITGGHLGRHLYFFKTLNDARVASVGFIMYNV